MSNFTPSIIENDLCPYFPPLVPWDSTIEHILYCRMYQILHDLHAYSHIGTIKLSLKNETQIETLKVLPQEVQP